MTDYEVLSAFLDHEPFDADALKGALADAEGRALLVDLIALRHVAQPDEHAVILPPITRPRRVVLWAAAAAGIAIAAASGYQVGVRRDALASAPPEPTVVVKAQWVSPSNGGAQ